MSSGPDPAILLFPTGVDIYDSKVDRGDIISGEAHTIPVSAPYEFFLAHVPQQSTISIPGFTEVTGTPLTNQFQTTYSGINAGLLSFNGINAGTAVSVSYTAAGDVVRAEWFNSLQISVSGVESYILNGLGITGTFMPYTGGSFIGDVTMNGYDLLTSVSGANNIGALGTPFATVYADLLNTLQVKNPAGTSELTLEPSLKLSGTNIILQGYDISLEPLGGAVGISGNVNISGSITPIATGLFDLGAPGANWGTIYADNIVSPGFAGAYVQKAGDTMSGNLRITGVAALKTNTINNDTSFLTIDSSSSLNIGSVNSATITSTAGNIDLNGLAVNINAAMSFAFGQTTTLGDIIPNASGVYNLGSATLPYDTVYANNLVGLNLSGNFVLKTGDSMSGNLVMGNPAGTGTQPTINTKNIDALTTGGDLDITAGEINLNATNNATFNLGPTGNQVLQLGLSNIYWSTDFLPSASGTYDIGSPSLYVDYVYANNIVAKTLESGVQIPNGSIGDITVTGTLTMGTGSSIVSAGSGTVTIGSSGNPIGSIYVDNIISNGSTGTYVQKAGDSMTGNLTMTGADILTSASGTNDIGSASAPFANIYADNITSSGLDDLYVNVTGDEMTGPLTLLELLSTGNMTISGVNNINMWATQIAQDAQQINLTTDTGAIIIDAQTEVQLLSNGVAKAVIENSGTEFYANIYPDTSGTHTVGTSDRPWAAIYANAFVGTTASGTGTYVLKIGDSMSGDLTLLVGVDLISNVSGSSNVGSLTSPFGSIYADSIHEGGVALSGLYVKKIGDTMSGDLSFSGSSSMGITYLDTGTLNVQAVEPDSNLALFAQSGVSILSSSDDIDLTAASNEINLIATQIDGIATDINWSVGGGSGTFSAGGYSFRVSSGYAHMQGGSGEYVLSSGGKVYIGAAGIDKIVTDFSGIKILDDVFPDSSGSYNLGTASLPFNQVYATGVNGRIATYPVYNEVPSGTVDSVNTVFYTAYLPVSGTERLYRAGLRMSPGGVDYSISGTGITFTTAPTVGDNLLVDYEYPVY